MTNTLAFFALERDLDHSGVSGTGRVAYAIQVDPGVLVLWDGEASQEPAFTLDWRPDLDTVIRIHGHGGDTRLVDLSDDCPAQQHAVSLLARVLDRTEQTLDAVKDLLG